ncbi:5'-nucleotidase domain-containing protein DDB_G0275467 isoform X3 [Tripterygium wilfordii]|uniref:5'-nucleotidase domain-containing protein DDB_G0275467 isoform X3 n=1 Tax=Tripterygium wilfordii TaxID=458696 RepID=UPI0018F7FD9B|nr:5'-nucleotidase domain-containing protein DDB_G0275467 isoform X3 [Tripterygium wilfordii]
MAPFLRLRTSLNVLQGTIIFRSRTLGGFGRGVRSYTAISSPEQALLKLEEEIRRIQTGKLSQDDEIVQIRHQFDAAKQSFLSIPEALKGIPKMNPEGIYVNKNLRLDSIQVYGFDYDYTLAHYSSALQSLIYDLAKAHMVNELKYPEICMKFKYDQSFPIRGLYYDKKNGCLLKLDFFGSIEPDGCYFGRRKACLISDIVQYFVDAKLEFDACYIYEDVNRAIQLVHRSGLVHRGILSDPHRYLVKNGQVLRFLRMLRDKGKKLFLMTNSPYYFVDGGMRFMLEDSIGYGNSWRELFDVVIAKANKPEFYTSEHPFRCYDTRTDTLAFTKVDAFHSDKVYYHGCLKSFLQITKWKGPEVIYFGDHLFSDLRGPSKAGWRTAAIIRELEHEIDIQNEDSYRFEQAKFHIIQELLGKLHATVASSQGSKTYLLLLDELNEERQKARLMMKSMFNKNFGATFLTDTGQESAFSYHIHQYADVYTSKPENFLLYPPEAWFHVTYDVKIMPHHVKVPSRFFENR